MVAALLLGACKHDTFTISGTIEGGAGHTLWLEEIAPEGPLFIDSIPIDSKGRFSYKYKMPYRSAPAAVWGIVWALGRSRGQHTAKQNKKTPPKKKMTGASSPLKKF